MQNNVQVMMDQLYNQLYGLLMFYPTLVQDGTDVDEVAASQNTMLGVIGDMLVFLRRIAISEKVQLQLCGARWTSVLLQVVTNGKSVGEYMNLTTACPDNSIYM